MLELTRKQLNQIRQFSWPDTGDGKKKRVKHYAIDGLAVDKLRKLV
jgi:hypothetical protein